MIHDQMFNRTTEIEATSVADRRRSDRVPFPAEIILEWNHSLGVALRYQVMDAGDGGYRILSSVPLLEGTTGMVVRLLPGGPGRGEPMGQPVMVAWCKDSDEWGGYELGIRCF